MSRACVGSPAHLLIYCRKRKHKRPVLHNSFGLQFFQGQLQHSIKSLIQSLMALLRQLIQRLDHAKSIFAYAQASAPGRIHGERLASIIRLFKSGQPVQYGVILRKHLTKMPVLLRNRVVRVRQQLAGILLFQKAEQTHKCSPCFPYCPASLIKRIMYTEARLPTLRKPQKDMRQSSRGTFFKKRGIAIIIDTASKGKLT